MRGCITNIAFCWLRMGFSDGGGGGCWKEWDSREESLDYIEIGVPLNLLFSPLVILFVHETSINGNFDTKVKAASLLTINCTT